MAFSRTLSMSNSRGRPVTHILLRPTARGAVAERVDITKRSRRYFCTDRYIISERVRMCTQLFVPHFNAAEEDMSVSTPGRLVALLFLFMALPAVAETPLPKGFSVKDIAVNGTTIHV